ncbi:sugar dehydrogenase complex small subunit [Robbsia sp. KACC 23696]|uniref:sugar dehydrogenase complex small subunit n=1 Tax=Robbsia sp. KACC 23696 TaxID=3149231 RepID=UPI00325BFEA2
MQSGLPRTTQAPAPDAAASRAVAHAADVSTARHSPPIDTARRFFIGGALALGTAPWLPMLLGGLWQHKAWAADGVPAASTAPAAVISAEARAAFLRVSHALSGDIPLDATQAEVLLAALQQQDAGFGDACVALDTFLKGQPADPLQWQAALDAAKAPFAALPRRILGAWFIGVVGSGTKARALTYVSSLMYRVTADRLRPPSYAYGSYGTWRVDPSTLTLPPMV